MVSARSGEGPDGTITTIRERIVQCGMILQSKAGWDFERSTASRRGGRPSIVGTLADNRLARRFESGLSAPAPTAASIGKAILFGRTVVEHPSAPAALQAISIVGQ